MKPNRPLRGAADSGFTDIFLSGEGGRRRRAVDIVTFITASDLLSRSFVPKQTSQHCGRGHHISGGDTRRSCQRREERGGLTARRRWSAEPDPFPRGRLRLPVWRRRQGVSVSVCWGGASKRRSGPAAPHVNHITSPAQPHASQPPRPL